MTTFSVSLREEEKVIACRLFFEAVLPSLAETANQMPEWGSSAPQDITILISGPYATGCQLSFDRDGSIHSAPWRHGQAYDLWLEFSKPDQVVALLRNGDAMPSIKAGWKHIGQLLAINRLTKLFQRHLKGPLDHLPAESIRKRALSLLSIAIKGSIVLSESDGRTFDVLAHTGPGTLALQLDSKTLAVLEWKNWRLWQYQASELAAERNFSAIINFQSVSALLELLEERADSLVALGKGQITVSGKIPLADAFSALLDRLSVYTN